MDFTLWAKNTKFWPKFFLFKNDGFFAFYDWNKLVFGFLIKISYKSLNLLEIYTKLSLILKNIKNLWVFLIFIANFYQKSQKLVYFKHKKRKSTIFEQKNFGQNFVFLAHSVKFNPAKFIICSILKHYGSKLCKIWANKVSNTLNLLINSLKNSNMGRFLKDGSIDFFQNTVDLLEFTILEFTIFVYKLLEFTIDSSYSSSSFQR
jgi:hypothetical protein